MLSKHDGSGTGNREPGTDSRGWPCAAFSRRRRGLSSSQLPACSIAHLALLAAVALCSAPPSRAEAPDAVIELWEQSYTLRADGSTRYHEKKHVRLNDPRTRKQLCWVGGGIVQGDPASLPVCSWFGDGYTDNSSCSR